ncbi:bifunctional metallophosphatase/5'-nucleotidase [Paenibacillus sp. NPDC057967]|uniref:bifunctional metallophosphatase/5'-nucleotidase n=1 Tax=Paenibacillus sp. NPDC057967 TaxID=3346293 RepID=UPI0036DE2568
MANPKEGISIAHLKRMKVLHMSGCITSTITILSTSDIHGFRCPPDQSPSLSDWKRLSALTDLISVKKRQHGSALLWIDNGDLYQGSPLSDYFMKRIRHQKTASHPMTEWLAAAGCDAFVPGNHEFNYGKEAIRLVSSDAPCPWLCANIVDSDTLEPYFGTPYRIWTNEAGVRAAVLGLTTAYIPHWELPAHIEGLAFLPAVEAARKWVPYLRSQQSADVVIVSYHGGFENDPATGEPTEAWTGENEGYRLCTEVKGIDVLLTGHQHRRIEHHFIGSTAIVQPGVYGSHLGEARLTLARSGDGRWSLQEAATQLIPVTVSGTSEQPEWLAPSLVELNRWMDKPLGRMASDLLIRNAHEVRLRKHPFIQWLNAVQMKAAGTSVALTALMDNHAPGFGTVVTMRDIAANYPYPNTLTVRRLSGYQVKLALEHSARYFELDEKGAIAVHSSFLYPKPQPFHYDMWDGIHYTLDISRPPGERVSRLLYDGAPLAMDQELEVAMNHYRASGSGGYNMMLEAPIVRQYTTEISDLMAEALSARAEWHVDLISNWNVIGERIN